MDREHFVAVFGGAVAGSEAAALLSEKNIGVVVFEMNPLPYGKIELGLPKWHHKLRDKQEAAIDEKLNDPNVHFIPNLKLGRDISVKEVTEEWGFSAVLLATGAWRDRALPLKGIDEYFGKNFLYQNPLIQWFNYCHDPKYDGPQYEIPDGTLIVGGGLASIDVCKIAMIKSVQAELKKQHGITVDAITLEKQGINPWLESKDLSLEKLGMKGATLIVREPVEEMPLTPLPEEATPEQKEKAGATRMKMLDKVRERFGFNIVNQLTLTDFKAEGGRIVSVTAAGHGKKAGDPPLEMDCPMLISAIGSLPEVLPGLPMDGEIYDVEDPDSGKIRGLDHVYAMGNAVTGRGNINQSRAHSRKVSSAILENYLSLDADDYESILDIAKERADERLGNIMDIVAGSKVLSAEQIDSITEKVLILQEKVAYGGDYQAWIRAHLPKRLEDML